MALSLGQYSRHNSTLKDILEKRSERQRKKSLGVLVKGGDRIPEHLIVEILSWLPVTTLLRFKTVCKSWYAIIKSSHFITKHLRNYYDANNNSRDCLIVEYAIDDDECNVFELLIDGKKNRTLACLEIETPIYNTYLCGPCDGIYYLWCCGVSSPKRSMWNPALNEFIILPEIPLNTVFIRESYGFGYDSKTKDYKVILILVCRKTPDEISTTILIYSLRSNSWRHWGDTDNYYHLEQNASSVNGCYYWLASRLSYDIFDFDWDYEMIVAFDIVGEAYHEIPLPHFEKKPGLCSHTSVYHDSIAFVHVPDDNMSSFSVYTWSEGVWTPQLSMKLDSEVWRVASHWHDNMLLILQAGRRLILYDTNAKEIFVLDNPAVGIIRNTCVYKESLVSIVGFQKDNVPQMF